MIDKLSELNGWSLNLEKNAIEKEFHFKSYLKNIAFVNAVAWIANKDNHHPDLIVKYNSCKVILTTHDQGGLSQKDFEMAKKIDLL
jgi:4a-hydroxytetrahydrobiopterin dehydratase